MLASRVFYAVAERFVAKTRTLMFVFSRFAVSWWGVETAKRQNRQPYQMGSAAHFSAVQGRSAQGSPQGRFARFSRYLRQSVGWNT